MQQTEVLSASSETRAIAGNNRMPDNKVQSREVFNEVVRLLNKESTVNEEGLVGFNSFSHLELISICARICRYKHEFTWYESYDITDRLYIELRKQGEVKPQRLWAEISKAAKQVEAAPQIPIGFWTECRLELPEESQLVTFSINGVKISIQRRPPRRWLSDLRRANQL
jgi:hypothetical protein